MTIKKIRSLTNQKIKDIVRLKTRRERVRRNLSIVEGKREMSQALNAGINFREYYIDSTRFNDDGVMKQILSVDNPTFDVTPEIFQKIAYGDRNEGILASFEIPRKTLNDLSRKSNGLYVIVEGVEKPGNLGAILRTCDGTAVDAVIVCNAKTDIFNPNVIRASLGTVFSMNVVEADNDEAFKFVRKNDIRIIATKPDAKKVYTKVDFTSPIALLVGSEDKGISSFWSENADEAVHIPMFGESDSLNVSTSTAIVLYEVIRQRSR